MKNIRITFVCVFLLISCIGCNTNKPSDADLLVSVSSYPSNPITTSYEPVEGGMGTVFKYKIRDNYNSRAEVEEEKNRVSAAFSDFKDRIMSQLNEEEASQALKDLHAVDAALDQYNADHFPLTSEENMQQEDEYKKRDLYGALRLAADDYEGYRYTGHPYYAEQIYNMMLEVVSDYEAGNITLDEALEKQHWVYLQKNTISNEK